MTLNKRISNFIYPNGKDFIFTIFDDTDVATLDYIRPIYDFLSEIEMLTTKSVWALKYLGKCNDSGSHTLENPFGPSGYVREVSDYIKELDKRGFEIGFHGPTMVSSKRAETERAFRIYHEILGKYPRIYASHSMNRENLYWGESRFTFKSIKKIYSFLSKEPMNYYCGHEKESEYFWGDLSLKHLEYVRNFTYNINMLNIGKKLPYSNKKKPWVKSWFYTCDADNVEEFNNLICEKNQNKLIRERGVCIITTHLGKGFNTERAIHKRTRELLTRLRSKNGWFVPVSEALDFLKAESGIHDILPKELFMMEIRWLIDSMARKLKRKSYLKTEVEYLKKEKQKSSLK